MTTELTLKQILANTNRFPEPKQWGVYFLIHQDEIVYVGKTTNLVRRYSTHRSEGRKIFDSFSYIELPSGDEEKLQYVETFYIWKFEPKYNQAIPLPEGFAFTGVPEYPVETLQNSRRKFLIEEIQRLHRAAERWRRAWHAAITAKVEALV